MPRRLKVLALLALLVAAAALLGCGGGDDDSGSSTSSQATEAPGLSTPAGGDTSDGAAGAQGGGQAGETEAQRQKHEARARATYERKRFGTPSRQSAPFSRYSGSSAEGKMHLAEFAEEASVQKRGEVEDCIQGYFGAVEAGDWAAACEALALETMAMIATIAEQKELAGCTEVLPAAIEKAEEEGRTGPVSLPSGVSSLRLETGGRAGEGAGFALFRGSDGTDYWMAVKRQEGRWRVLSTLPEKFQ